ncbi:right-handed parallel beta-helix repeat-containing protein [Halobium salinum]|uniref:Right-handed parallel beta-helix repeat-containing protein n=1 Tax=Halobium salinum TaxID=1364940 RepID=A0ABD5PGI5_9EURY|nr:right-handed parallel beta-helix repeat-containing protein [Halobium salinum]
MAAGSPGSFTRRQFVGGFGAGTLSLTRAPGGVRAAQQSQPYDRIVISAGETRTFELGDGDVLENTIIDITASGATAFVYAAGRGWTIRNVAVVGRHPERNQPVLLAKDFGGGSVVENCYFGGDPSAPKATAVFVHAEHSGDLLVRNCVFEDWTDNAIYASPPGNPDIEHYRPDNVGQGGTVRVENCYFENVHVAGVRLGTDGSYARNCVFNGGPHRGFWGYYGETTYTNCHAVANYPFYAGGLTYEKQGSATMVLEDCCGEGTLEALGGAEIRGDPCRAPQTSPPAGVPMSARAAASGPPDAASNGTETTAGGESDPAPATDRSRRWFWPVAAALSLLTSNPLLGLLVVLAVVALVVAWRRSDRFD